MLRALVSAVLTVSLLALPSPDPSGSDVPPPLTRSDRWRAVAMQALDAYAQTAAPTSFKPFTHSQALLAVGRLYGWDDPRVPTLIAQLLGERTSIGGWGI